jgi:uncharacterized membrane protein YphA (DoxX/SURF4 family)
MLRIALWTVQILLALAFLGAGTMKLTTPVPDLVGMGMWYADDAGGWLIRFIGLSETLGAIGLVLPAATRILPWLTPLAAAGLTTIMVLAMGTHASAGEWGALPVNAVLGGLAAFVAWGRAVKAPIPAR